MASGLLAALAHANDCSGRSSDVLSRVGATSSPGDVLDADGAPCRYFAYFTKELPKRHANAFAYTSKDRFEPAAAQVEREIDHLNSDEVYMRLDHLANLIGDAHTYVEFPDDNANLPLDFTCFLYA
jgi:hypothetical protein